MSKKTDEKRNKIIKIVCNVVLALGVGFPLGLGILQIPALDYYDRVLQSCDAFEDEAYWKRVEEKGTDFTDCNSYNGLLGSVVSGQAYTSIYTLFSTSAIFVGFLIIYNKK